MEISLAVIGCSSGGGRHLLLLDFNNVKQPSTAAVNVNRCPCPFSPHSGQSPPLKIMIIGMIATSPSPTVNLASIR